MKKQQIILLIIISSLISALVYPISTSPLEGGFPFLPSSSPPQQTVGSGAGEFDNVDTFDVHPAGGRWRVEENAFTTNDIYDTCLRCSDIGSGGSNYYRLFRDIQNLDDSINIRFKLITNDTETSHNNDAFFVRLTSDTAHTDDYFEFRIKRIGAGNGIIGEISYEDTNGGAHTKTLTSGETCTNDTWYKLRMDYDILKSEFRVRLYTDANSRLFDYDWQDISSAYIPGIFEGTSLEIGLYTYSYSTGLNVTSLIDYVDASFAERDWLIGDTADTPNWLHYSPYHVAAVDDIDDEINYSLCIPYMDAASGIITIEFEKNSTADFDNLDDAAFRLRVYGIDADDGDLHQLAMVRCWVQFVGGDNFLRAGLNLYHGTTLNRTVYKDDTEVPFAWPKYIFEITTREKRRYVDIIANFWPDREDTGNYFMGLLTIDVNDYVTDVSQEFTLNIDYDADFTGDNTLLIALNDFDFLRRESMRGVSPNADGWVATGSGEHPASGGATDPFSIIWETITKAITDALGTLGQFLEPFIDGLEGLLGSISTLLGGISTTLGGLAAATAAAIWSGISDTLSFITDAIGIVVENFFDWLWGVASEMGEFLVDVIEVVLPLLQALAEAIFGVAASIVFWVWDALGLPDLLAIVEVLLTGFVQLVNNLPGLISAYASALQTLWYLTTVVGILLFFGLPLAQKDIGGYIDAMVTYMAIDLTCGFRAAGFGMRLPAVAVWLVCMISLILSNTIYAGFF